MRQLRQGKSLCFKLFTALSGQRFLLSFARLLADPAIRSLWSPNIQLTFGHFDTSSPGAKRTWKSVNVSHFVTPPPAGKAGAPALDKRSSKSDQFSITVDPANPDIYVLEGKYDSDVQVSLEFKRTPGVPGWKLGAGPRGGFSYFGKLKAGTAKSNPSIPDITAGSDGYAVHRFWPRAEVKGIVRMGGQVLDLANSRGTFIHAIQGMRPDTLACRWNFADFQSSVEDKVSLVMMEFTTTTAYKRQVVNVGSVVVDDKLVAVTLGGTGLKHGGKAEHQDLALDKDTGYNAPRKIAFEWTGPAIEAPSANVSASILLDLAATPAPADGSYQTKGLVEKVDVMGEIPYIIKKVVHAVAGAKPFVYQVRSFSYQCMTPKTCVSVVESG